MTWLIGIDEAGYGPNLGPLVVAASVWWVEEELRVASGEWREKEKKNVNVSAVTHKHCPTTFDLYTRLAEIVSSCPSTTCLSIADSKKLYKPGTGLRQLERGVLVALKCCGETAGGWASLLGTHLPEVPWYANYQCNLPIDADGDEINDLTARFHSACDSTGVRLQAVRTRMIFPREFNALTAHFGTKGAALSHVSIGLMREVMDQIPSHQPPTTNHFFITCDKHGGRNRYLALLQHFFPDEWIDTLAESGPVSHYAWGNENSRAEICFRCKGEAELPVALASMTAKYHRELAMRAFNDYWCRKVPGLKPTAGYPQDAKRFKAAISSRQTELQISDSDLWRER